MYDTPIPGRHCSVNRLKSSTTDSKRSPPEVEEAAAHERYQVGRMGKSLGL